MTPNGLLWASTAALDLAVLALLAGFFWAGLGFVLAGAALWEWAILLEERILKANRERLRIIELRRLHQRP